MSSILTGVFKATIGLLVRKGRGKAAEKLKDGDVTDEKFRRLIVREIDDIKSKLDGLSRKDLLASISFFKEGIELLYEVFDKARSRSGSVTSQDDSAEAFSFVKGMRNLELSGLDESATRKLANAKERFSDARKKATEAFNNEALETSQRILAMQYRVMATILETVDNPADAVAPCRVCIEELHCLPSVQGCFGVELRTKKIWARFGKDERRKIISNVCHVNFVIYGVTLMICFGNKELSNWPCIGSGEKAVDPLRDGRVAKVLRKQGMENCCVTSLSFGQEGEEEHTLETPEGITTNSNGHFIVADNNNVKMFDSSGDFSTHFSPPSDDVNVTLNVLDVASDMNDDIYVLVKLNNLESESVVYKFDENANRYDTFPVRGGHWYRVTATDRGKVLVLGRPTAGEPRSVENEICDKKGPSSRTARRVRILRSAFRSPKPPVLQASRPEERDVVDVYESDGQLVRSFGERELKDARDITVANDGRVMVLDRGDDCVHVFNEDGDHLDKFKLQGCYSYPKIAFHQASEHVVVGGIEQEESLVHVQIYNKDGVFVRSSQIHEEGIEDLQGITVTTEGRIGVVFRVIGDNYKVLVM
ncbi:hypothetical protein ACROYT_G025221 [Oculina patagonica]